MISLCPDLIILVVWFYQAFLPCPQYTVPHTSFPPHLDVELINVYFSSSYKRHFIFSDVRSFDHCPLITLVQPLPCSTPTNLPFSESRLQSPQIVSSSSRTSPRSVDTLISSFFFEVYGASPPYPRFYYSRLNLWITNEPFDIYRGLIPSFELSWLLYSRPRSSAVEVNYRGSESLGTHEVKKTCLFP